MNKGLKILLDRYWTSTGWKDDDVISKKDFAIAKAEGYMFDNIPRLTHDETLAELKNVLDEICYMDISNAFLYSLSTRKLEYRSALGSYWFAVAIPQHAHDEGYGVLGDKKCYLCGWDSFRDPNDEANVNNFTRYKWGGVSHDNVNYALFDLKQFGKLPKVEPTQEDIKILKDMLSCADLLRETDKVGKLRDAILKAKIFKTNKAELSVILNILGICGVLATKECPCYAEKFVDEYERGPIEYKNDFAYPVNRWRKRDGINAERFKKVFFDL